MSSPINTGIETVVGLLREQLPPEMVVTEPSAIIALVRPWKAQVQRCPSVVARCRTTADVQAAVRG
jgi:FAD/FMN-containing dehydrogenase